MLTRTDHPSWAPPSHSNSLFLSSRGLLGCRAVTSFTPSHLLAASEAVTAFSQLHSLYSSPLCNAIDRMFNFPDRGRKRHHTLIAPSPALPLRAACLPTRLAIPCSLLGTPSSGPGHQFPLLPQRLSPH